MVLRMRLEDHALNSWVTVAPAPQVRVVVSSPIKRRALARKDGLMFSSAPQPEGVIASQPRRDDVNGGDLP